MGYYGSAFRRERTSANAGSTVRRLESATGALDARHPPRVSMGRSFYFFPWHWHSVDVGNPRVRNYAGNDARLCRPPSLAGTWYETAGLAIYRLRSHCRRSYGFDDGLWDEEWLAQHGWDSVSSFGVHDVGNFHDASTANGFFIHPGDSLDLLLVCGFLLSDLFCNRRHEFIQYFDY